MLSANASFQGYAGRQMWDGGNVERGVTRGEWREEGKDGLVSQWHLLSPSLSISRAHATSWELPHDLLGSALAQAGPCLSTSHLSGSHLA